MRATFLAQSMPPPGARRARARAAGASRKACPTPWRKTGGRWPLCARRCKARGRHARCGGPFIFQTPMRVCMRTRQSLCRAQTPCAVPCAARRAFRAASSARPCRPCWPRAARAAKHAPAGAKHKGHFCLLFLRRRAAGPPVAPS